MIRKNEFIGYLGKICDIVELDDSYDWFHYRSDEKEGDLPKVGAFCKDCAKETAKPIYPIFMNGRPAYALQCTKCGNEYAMYKHTFFSRYIGSTTKNGGRINPTKGMMSRFDAMDRKAREEYNSIPKRVEDDLCKAFGYSHEEYEKMKSEWDENDKKLRKKWENDEANRRAHYQEEKMKKASEERKTLIAKGVLQYVKNIGLVNTETGEVVKL